MSELLRRTIGEALQERRRSMGWTLQHVAERMGVSKSRVSEIENARINLTIDALDGAADALGLAVLAIPREKLEAVMTVLGANKPHRQSSTVQPSTYDELFIPDDAEPTDEPTGGPYGGP